MNQLFDKIDEFMASTDTVVVLTRKPNGLIELVIRPRDDHSLKRVEKFHKPLQCYEWLKVEIDR